MWWLHNIPASINELFLTFQCCCLEFMLFLKVINLLLYIYFYFLRLFREMDKNVLVFVPEFSFPLWGDMRRNMFKNSIYLAVYAFVYSSVNNYFFNDTSGLLVINFFFLKHINFMIYLTIINFYTQFWYRRVCLYATEIFNIHFGFDKLRKWGGNDLR